MADVSVRPARPGDAAEVARIQVETWKTAYGDILPAVVLEALDSADAEPAWNEAITRPPTPRHHLLVALEGDWLVGFVAVAPADDLEDTDPDPDATAAFGPLLVEPRWGRRGHGSRLLAAAVDHATADGMSRAVIWLPEGDEVSREFLMSTGWSPEGLLRALDTGAGELREVRLRTAFDSDPAAPDQS